MSPKFTRSLVEDHQLHSLSIPRHPLHLNEYDQISLLIPSIPPLPDHLPEPVSPVPTEIAMDLPVVERTPDFAYESVPNSCKAPEVFDPVPSLIATDWHMRNSHKNRSLLMPKAPHQDRLARARPSRSVSTLAPSSLTCPRSITISRTSGDTRSSCWRTNACRRLLGACGCVAKLALPFIGTTIRTASFSAMTPPAARTMRTRTLVLLLSRLAYQEAQLLRNHRLGRGRRPGQSQRLNLGQQSPRRNPERLGIRRRREVGGNLYEGSFRVRGIDSLSFIVTETHSFAHTAHTHTTHFLYLFIVSFHVVVVDYSIAHWTLYSESFVRL